MAALTAKQVRAFVRTVQDRFGEIDHEDWDASASRYRRHEQARWEQATREAVPPEWSEWREFIRVLAQGESHYGGRY